MRMIAHLVSVLLLLPGIVVAAALLALGHLTGQPNFLRLVEALFDLLLAFFPLAFLVAVAWFALAALGFSQRWHRAASIIVAVVAIATTGTIVWVANVPPVWSEAGIFVPAAGAIVIAVWLASTDAAARRSGGRQALTDSDPRC